MKPRLLVVDDDLDTREMLVEWLSMEGYDPVGTATADEALAVLRKEKDRIDLVLTDYMLPDRHGLDLVRTALGEHLLTVDRVLLLSGAPPMEAAAALGVRVIKKPIDLVALVTEIERVLHTIVRPPASRTPAVTELVMYVSADSPTSLRAVRTLKKRIAALPDGTVSFEIREISAHLAEALEHRIAFTPTLVRIAPKPMVRLIGDLRDESALDDVLPSSE